MPPSRQRALLVLGTVLVLAHYLRAIWSPEGGTDLLIRVSESKYFFHGIDPYKVYIGLIPPVDRLGDPNAYPVWSYYYAGLFWFGERLVPPVIMFTLADVACLAGAIVLVARAHEYEWPRDYFEFWPVFLTLGASVFFMQQARFMNFNVQAMFFIALVAFGLAKNRPAAVIAGAALLAVKPSFALPVYLYLAMGGHWRALGWVVAILTVQLVAAAGIVHENPLVLLRETADTQRRFAEFSTGGMLSAVQPLLRDSYSAVAALVGLVVLALVLRPLRRDPWLSCAACICVSLSFFYNQVHGYVVAAYVVIIGLTTIRRERLPPFLCLAVLFLDVPRLYGVFHFDAYVALHNTLRCALLFAMLWVIVRSPRMTSAPVSAPC